MRYLALRRAKKRPKLGTGPCLPSHQILVDLIWKRSRKHQEAFERDESRWRGLCSVARVSGCRQDSRATCPEMWPVSFVDLPDGVLYTVCERLSVVPLSARRIDYRQEEA